MIFWDLNGNSNCRQGYARVQNWPWCYITTRKKMIIFSLIRLLRRDLDGSSKTMPAFLFLWHLSRLNTGVLIYFLKLSTCTLANTTIIIIIIIIIIIAFLYWLMLIALLWSMTKFGITLCYLYNHI